MTWIKSTKKFLDTLFFFMAKVKASDLVRHCNELLRAGKDFPTILNTAIKDSQLMAGVPHQRMIGKRALLEIWLVTGQRLVFDGDVKEFRLE